MSRRPTAEKSAAVLEPRLRGFKGELTVADAAARGGLALRDAEDALFHISSQYHGHLKATEAGELVFSFPRGLTKPVGQDWASRALRSIIRGASGVGRFVVRAWVSTVLVAYALVLVGVVIALAVRDSDSDVGDSLGLVLQMVFEALWWTFHPFSPFAWGHQRTFSFGHRSRRRQRDVPFYEKVNRFVFGPPPPSVDPRLVERALIAEIRRLQGRVAPADVMRITGGTREEAEARLCRLLVDHDGQIEITDDGAVMYRFADLQKTVERGETTLAEPIWKTQLAPIPITGNRIETNMLLSVVNGFNVAASGYVLANGLTIDHIGDLLSAPRGVVVPPSDETALVLGAIPFTFSALVFALPIGRAVLAKSRAMKVARENARRAVLKTVLADGGRAQVSAQELTGAWLAAGAGAIEEHDLTAEVRRIGGEPDVDDQGKVIYRFTDIAAEKKALTAARSSASPDERKVAPVAFSTDKS